jgi:hypothetical protein
MPGGIAVNDPGWIGTIDQSTLVQDSVRLLIKNTTAEAEIAHFTSAAFTVTWSPRSTVIPD